MTEFVGEVEQELIEAADFRPERNYNNDRQKYLEALLRSCIHDIDDDQFDRLSDPAAEWCNIAAICSKEGRPLPDFEGGIHENGQLPFESGRYEATANSAPDQEAVVQLEGGLAEDESEQQPKEKKKNKGGRPKKIKEATLQVTPKPKKAKGKPKKTVHENRAIREARGSNVWGVTLGTKSDMACKMAAQEGGTTMKEIKEVTGDTRYNVFNRIKRHHPDCVKYEEGRIYLYNPPAAVALEPVEQAAE